MNLSNAFTLFLNPEMPRVTITSYIMIFFSGDFRFMPCRNTFRYPQSLNWWDAVSAGKDGIFSIAERENCNPYTVLECIRAMHEIRGKKFVTPEGFQEEK